MTILVYFPTNTFIYVALGAFAIIIVINVVRWVISHIP